MSLEKSGCSNECSTICNRKVGLNLYSKPTVWCNPCSKEPECTYDIFLEFDIKPKCTLIKCDDPCPEQNGCRVKCHYLAKLEFNPCFKTVCSEARSTSCDYDVVIGFDSYAKCKSGDDDCADKKSHQKPAEDLCGCPDCQRSRRY